MKMQKLLSIVLALGLAGFLTACNTMAGFGEDMESTGKAIEEEAED